MKNFSRTIEIRAMSSILTSLFFLFFFLALNNGVSGAADPPIHRLNISFDLEKNRIKGVSQIDVPANTGINIFLGDLAVESIVHKGEALLPETLPLTLELPPEANPQNISITFAKEIPEQAGNIESLISAEGIVLSGFWHPMLGKDSFQTLTAIIPADFEAIAETDDLESKKTEKGKEVTFTFPAQRRTVSFVAGPYVVEKEIFGDGKELYSYFFPEDQDLAESYRQKTVSYLKRYEAMIGPYPYKRYAIIENRLPTGFAMPSFTLLGQAIIRLPFILETSLGHEVLHSWFGNSIDIDLSQGNWAEGLTTYLADQLYAQDKNQDAEFRKGQLLKIHNFVNQENAIPLVAFKNALDTSKDKKAIRAIGYGKTSMLFHMLRKSLGDELFFKALQDFYKRMNGKEAKWDDIITSFETVAGSKMEEYFTQWLEQKDLPDLEVKDISSEEKEGVPVLAFTLAQKNDTPYVMDVPIVIQTMQGEVRKTIHIKDNETKIEIPLAGTPLELAIDPNYDIIRQLDHDEIPPVWSGFLGDADKLAVIGTAADRETFAPFLDILQAMDCPIAEAEDVTTTELANMSVIFLGVDNPLVRSIFAKVGYPEKGFTLDVRKNPLSPEKIAVLTSAANKSAVELVSRKLEHYGKYSYLHFENGRIRDKKITAADSGLIYILHEPPTGIEVQSTIGFNDILNKILDKQVVYVGETHSRYEDHKLQLEVVRALYNHNPQIAIGMEMFARTIQPALDDYISGKSDEATFLKESRYFKNWGYDYRNYRPIIEFARRNQIPILGLNLEKKIPSKVYKENGIDSLTDQEKETIPPDRDLSIPGYQERIAQAFRLHLHQPGQSKQFTNFLQSQALWDETMAETVSAYLAANPETKVVVIAGQGHVFKDTAIPPRVARRVPVAQSVLINAAGKPVDSRQVDFALFLPPEALPPKAMMGVLLAEEDQRLVISKISKSGKAKEAGIKEKDVILALDGKAIEILDDLKIAMLYKEKGDTVTLRVQRKRALFGKKEMDIVIQL